VLQAKEHALISFSFVVLFYDSYLVFQVIWGCVIEDVIIFFTCNVYGNAYRSKSKVQKSNFFNGF
jgi:hypothetical protein